MIKIENTATPSPQQWENAIMGCRNAFDSWDKSDSDFENFKIGKNDLDLMMRLKNAGPAHRKFMRMLPISVTITAPLYWWKEMETYRVGVAPNPTDIEMNSCSTMHRIHAKEFTLDDFSHEKLFVRQSADVMKETIDVLNILRDVYLNGGILKTNGGNFECFGKRDKRIWYQMIQLLPSSYNQKRTIALNYEASANIYGSRNGHKLDCWNILCAWMETLPCSELITGNIPQN